MKRSDLIIETACLNADDPQLVRREKYGIEYLSMISDDGGKYFTVFKGGGSLTLCLRDILSGLVPEGKALVAGLGNAAVCSDSLGVKALRYVPATAHLSSHSEFSELGLREVCVLEAGVTGKTGIESSARVACEARCAGAKLVIAIDSLACSGLERLCSAVQLTDAGIKPGSGVGNDRAGLDSGVCGVPVIAVGVPTVMDLSSAADIPKGAEGLMVTPRDIDAVTDRFAKAIGTAVSMALNPGLSEKELMALRLD